MPLLVLGDFMNPSDMINDTCGRVYMVEPGLHLTDLIMNTVLSQPCQHSSILFSQGVRLA